MRSTLALPRIEISGAFAFGVGAAIVAAALIVYLVKRAGDGGAQAVGAFAARVPIDVASGIVLGVGDALGVPRTDESKCDRALREGRLWDASFACPALRFIREGIFSSGNPNPPRSNNAPGYSGASGSW